MSYLKPLQTTFAANLMPDEFVVTLDTGQNVAVCSQSARLAGNTLQVTAAARQVDAAGLTLDDGNGHLIQSSMAHSFDVASVTAYGAPALTKDCLLLVLGEPTVVFGATPGLPPMDASARDAYSIRHAIAAATHAGATANLGAML